jgi:hypothetical protein
MVWELSSKLLILLEFSAEGRNFPVVSLSTKGKLGVPGTGVDPASEFSRETAG